jgi:hypothetical protein
MPNNRPTPAASLRLCLLLPQPMLLLLLVQGPYAFRIRKCAILQEPLPLPLCPLPVLQLLPPLVLLLLVMLLLPVMLPPPLLLLLLVPVMLLLLVMLLHPAPLPHADAPPAAASSLCWSYPQWANCSGY